MSYSKFARIYDLLMDKDLYFQWANFVFENVPCHQTILDLACGSGDLLTLLNKNYDVIGADLSEDMLVVSREKLPGSIPLLQLDMRDFELENRVDAITCFADSLCYLKDKEELQSAFQHIYVALKPGGVFLFDVHSIQQMAFFDTYQFQYVDNTTVFTWESEQGADETSVRHYLTGCVELDNGLYERFDEVHEERTYPVAVYLDLLKRVGFSTVEVSSNFGQDPVTDESTRLFFKCIK